MEAQKASVFSEKVCFICHFVARTDDESRKRGFYVFVVDLSELVDGCMKVLKPNFRLEFDIGMSVSALGSTLYFTNALYAYRENPDEIPNVYSLDIQTLNQSQEVGAADFCTLPCMWGKKYLPLMASIPSTKKILVFSSEYSAYPGAFPGRSEYVHFEMFDVETNSWEKLPQFLIRVSKKDSGTRYLLHLSHVDERATQIPINDMNFEYLYRYEIYGYALMNEGAVFVVQLSCGVKLSLDLSSASKSWQLYNEHSRIVWTYPCARREDIRVPKSLYGKDDPVKRVHSVRTALDGEDRVCVVRGGIGGLSKHARVTLDVVDLLAENLLAFYNFVVEENKFKYFMPLFAFVYPHHPK